MKNLARILAPALLAAAAACATSPAPGSFKADPEMLYAEGSADFNAADLGASRDKAVLDAQRSAVRRAAELYMDDTARAENYPALENGPLKTPQLYVAKHKVVSEGQDGAFYRVGTKVWVYHDRLASALRGLNLAGKAAAGPVAAFVQGGTPAPAFAKTFRDAFTKRSAVTIKEFPFTAEQALVSGPREALIAAASAAGADLLIFASAFPSPSGAGINTGFYPSKADASAVIYEAKTGKSLLELSIQANAIDSLEAVSFSKALASAGDLLAQEAAAKSDRFLRSDAAIRVKISGVDGLAALEKIKAQLQRVDVKGLRLESYSSGVALFTVEPIHPDPQEFASAVLRGDSLGLELEGTGAQEVAFSLHR